IAAEPTHGESWCRVSKCIRNWQFKTPDVLRAVVRELSVPV
ncbi:hypothetical protein AWZ03_015137, partial [Drosophila navojoa]